MNVEEIMTTDLVTVSIEESLQEAVTRMLDARVGSAIVENAGAPVGIVTETDVLAVGTSFDRSFDGIPVSRAMSRNLVTTGPETTLDDAIETMHDHGIKKLPVVDGDELVGIVTMTDFVYTRYELAREAQRLERRRAELEREADPSR